MKHKFIFLILSICFFDKLSSQPSPDNKYVRGDAKVEFKWRFGYSEFPVNMNSSVEAEDAFRGTYGWFDGYFWAGSYKNWNDSTLHGVSLLYRGGSPYARAVRCHSELVPMNKAGLPVTFAIPVKYTIGSESKLTVSIRAIGQGDETVILQLNPQKESVVTNGQMKVVFNVLQLISSDKPTPSVQIAGMLHLRIYPGLLNYGGRMVFEFNSLTHHMDVESSLLIGSLWKDVSQTDIAREWERSGLTESKLAMVDSLHQEKLKSWKEHSKQMYNNINKQAQVTVLCSADPKPWDRGELRVQAYSGNPVKDFQFGPITGQVDKMAESVVKQIGKKFSIFRYQHHRLPWLENQPQELNPEEKKYLDQWLHTASKYSDRVILDLQISPVIKEYRTTTQMGTKPLPQEGLNKFTWENICEGYITTLKYAKKVCPQLQIIQVPYEFDNISDTECHRDAHYELFKVVYKAVNAVNKNLPVNEQLQVAGLGVNNPVHRWDFIDGFLQRYYKDTDRDKRLDYLTWHAYLFPRDKPNHPKGFSEKLKSLLSKNNLPLSLPVIIDESGLAEPSTIEDLSDLEGASAKEAAMACFTASIHDWYLKEEGNFIPITGAGWHFSLMTYGKQNVLSPYAKGMLLRSRLYDNYIPSQATPIDESGYGLYSFATKQDKNMRILVWSASPSIFYQDALPLNYDQTEIVFKDIPDSFKKGKIKVTVESSSPSQQPMKDILALDKCQTLPLTRGADRYSIDFDKKEEEQINAISMRSYFTNVENDQINISLDVKEHSMYLITLEAIK